MLCRRGRALVVLAILAAVAEAANHTRSEDDEDGGSIWETLEDVMIVMLASFGLFVIFALRDLWIPVVWENTVERWSLPSLRNIHCVGWLASRLCPGMVGSFHEAFRLRIAFQEAWNLKKTDMLSGMTCYIVVSCGNNPPKTTSAKSVPSDNRSIPVVWNDILDLEVGVADDFVRIQIIDMEIEEGDGVIGEALLTVTEFYDRMEGTLEVGKTLPDFRKKLRFKNQDAGELVLTLWATRPGHPLPAIARGMGLPTKGEKDFAGKSRVGPTPFRAEEAPLYSSYTPLVSQRPA